MIKHEVHNLLLGENSRLKEEKIFSRTFPEIYSDLNSGEFLVEFNDFKFSQKLYHYFHDDRNLSLGLCKCGKRCRFISFKSGYVKHCCKECAMKDVEVKEKQRETCLKLYSVDNAAKSEFVKNKKVDGCVEKYGVSNVFQLDGVKEKRKKALVEKFGVDCPMKSDVCLEKYIETTKDKYGVEFYMQSNEGKDRYRETCVEKYGVDWFSKSDEYRDMHDDIQEKSNQTKRKNKTFNSSKIEQQIEEYLERNNIRFIHQYSSELYPFACDFYLSDYDLYVEIQGTWTHGGHPYDMHNPEDVKKLEIWKSKNSKYYENAIETWSQRDVRKRETAKANNLNYVEIFSSKFDVVIEILSHLLFFLMKL